MGVATLAALVQFQAEVEQIVRLAIWNLLEEVNDAVGDVNTEEMRIWYALFGAA